MEPDGHRAIRRVVSCAGGARKINAKAIECARPSARTSARHCGSKDARRQTWPSSMQQASRSLHSERLEYPAGNDKKHMTPDQYRAALSTLGLSQQAAGRWLMVSPKTAQNYATKGPSGPAARSILMALKLSPKAWAAELASAGALPPGGVETIKP